MSPIVYRTVEVLSALVESMPVGTNLGLLHVLWTLVSGRLLAQRGALVPALWASGLTSEAVLRAWRALAHGRWQCAPLVEHLQRRVAQEGRWQPHTHGGFHPVACDLTAFFRPTLRDCQTRHFDADAKRMLAALPFGLAVRVGSVDGQRIPIPLMIQRAAPELCDETEQMRRLLRETASQLGAQEVVVADRGFGVALLQECAVQRFVVRVQQNAVAYRAERAAYSGRGRKPVRGLLVRPLARRYKGQMLAATPPDASEAWEEKQGTIQAQVWKDLATKSSPAGAAPYRIVAIHDPAHRQPLLLATTLPDTVTAQQLRNIYIDRWPVELVPQTAKQMLGAHRQFVFGRESRWRLPELALLAACVALYVAATQPACATGFWDRKPKPTAGRLRRVLAQAPFPQTWPQQETIRKKNSVTAHLPKGSAAHRRQPSGLKRPNQHPKRRPTRQVTRN